MTVQYGGGAESLVNDYLDRVRDRLSADESVDAEEVASDLRSHIERELAEKRQPVSEADVNGVLNQLGAPAQFVSQEDRSWWEKMLVRWRSGDEGWRLAYLSFGALTIGTLITGPLGIIAGFVLARAALSVAGEPVPSAKKWLIYPSLIIVYLLLALIAACGLLWPAPAMGVIFGSFFHSNVGSPRSWAPVLAGATLGLAVWWSLLWAIGHHHLSVVRTVFRPFAHNWTGRTFRNATLGAWAVTLLLTSIALILWLR